MTKKPVQGELVIDRSESQIEVAQPMQVVQKPPIPTDPASMILAMIDKAAAHNLTAETMGKFMDLYDRAKKDAAERAYNAAMAAFKLECPTVVKRTENAQFKVNRNGQMVNRTYASEEDVAEVATPFLSKHGMHVRWSDLIVVDGKMTMSCIVRHIDGHEEKSSATFPLTSNAGCSEQQKYGIVAAYCKRYSMLDVLGLTPKGEDQDGNDTDTRETITEDQAANLVALMDEVNVPRDTFLKWAKVDRVDQLPKSRHKEAVTRLEAKRGAK